jgi:hypothetical protein
MSLGAVQKSLRRAQKLAGGEPADVVAAVCDDELKCHDVQAPEDVERLSALERWRAAASGHADGRSRAGTGVRPACRRAGRRAGCTDRLPVSLTGTAGVKVSMPPGPTSDERPTPANVHRGVGLCRSAQLGQILGQPDAGLHRVDVLVELVDAGQPAQHVLEVSSPSITSAALADGCSRCPRIMPARCIRAGSRLDDLLRAYRAVGAGRGRSAPRSILECS